MDSRGTRVLSQSMQEATPLLTRTMAKLRVVAFVAL